MAIDVGEVSFPDTTRQRALQSSWPADDGGHVGGVLQSDRWNAHFLNHVPTAQRGIVPDAAFSAWLNATPSYRRDAVRAAEYELDGAAVVPVLRDVDAQIGSVCEFVQGPFSRLAILPPKPLCLRHNTHASKRRRCQNSYDGDFQAHAPAVANFLVIALFSTR
jgi:hypothetical protein